MIIHLIFIAVSLSMIIPLLLVIAISITEEKSIIQHGYNLIPVSISFEAYHLIFKSPMILIRAYGVTILVTILGTLGGLLLTAMIGYGISRRDYRYNRITTFYVFFTMLFSGGLVPTYILVTQYLHLRNSIWALILPGMVSPFYVMLMKGFLSKIPFEVIESAKIDGAREWRIFFTIILRLSTPAMATLGLFISFNYWNAWFPALLYIDNEKLVPVQLLLMRMMQQIEFLKTNADFVNQLGIDLSEFPSLSARMAFTIIAAGPMMFIFPFFQRYFVQGLTVGSLKG
ncbi:ABC transporter permease subunit [Paenibacillus sp. LMG 31461]|uniref:ABC transporter permease subunit n=2 Tax=Paenibacillus plantarum TaxID=2654975 RepID=A0ABX1X984_9BACL|nr:carbohydrate ABC transporter permease [Paenibacillus plantarum]NOU64636.1 ABC transporter permease subunit [Paenibacillus plantarum]